MYKTYFKQYNIFEHQLIRYIRYAHLQVGAKRNLEIKSLWKDLQNSDSNETNTSQISFGTDFQRIYNFEYKEIPEIDKTKARVIEYLWNKP